MAFLLTRSEIEPVFLLEVARPVDRDQLTPVQQQPAHAHGTKHVIGRYVVRCAPTDVTRRRTNNSLAPDWVGDSHTNNPFLTPDPVFTVKV